jgi:hypothetical protein
MDDQSLRREKSIKLAACPRNQFHGQFFISTEESTTSSKAQGGSIPNLTSNPVGHNITKPYKAMGRSACSTYDDVNGCRLIHKASPQAVVPLGVV